MPDTSLSFIDHGLNPKEARRIVRSNAMTDYRRKQREALGNGTTSSPPKEERKPPNPVIMKFSLGNDTKSRSKAKRLSSKASIRSKSASRAPTSTSDEITRSRSVTQKSELGHLPSSLMDASSSWSSPHSPGQFSEAQPSVPAIMPHEPWYRYLVHVESYCAFLDKGRAITGAVNPANNFLKEGIQKYCIDNQCLHMVVLLSMAHFDAQRNIPATQYAYHDAYALKNLRRVVSTPVHMIPDSSVGGVTTYSMYQFLASSPHAPVHVDAMRSLIRLRGGFSSIQSPIVQNVVKIMDFIYSFASDTLPEYCPMDEPQLYIPREAIDACTDETNPGHLISSPLLVCDSFQRISEISNIHALPQLISILHEAWDSFGACLARERARKLSRTRLESDHFEFSSSIGNALPTTNVNNLEESKANLVYSDLNYGDDDWAMVQMVSDGLALPLDPDPPSFRQQPESDPAERKDRFTKYIGQACTLAARIWHRAVTSMIPFSHSSNTADMRALFILLNGIGLEPWIGLPFLHLWCVSVGYAAATPDEIRYFTAEMVRDALSFYEDQPNAYDRFMMNFIWLKRLIKERNKIPPV